MRPIQKIVYCSLFLLFFVPTASAQKALIDSLKKQLAVAKPDTNKVNLLYELNVATQSSDPKQALAYAWQCYALAEKLKWKKGMVKGLRNVGAIQMDMGKNDEALINNQRLYKLAEELDNKDVMIASLINIGAVYERTSQYTKSADYFFKALKIAEQAKYARFIAICESNIAVLFISQRDFQKARYYAKKADLQYQHLNLKLDEAKNLEVLGNCYAFDAKHEEARPYYLKALKLYGNLNDLFGKATVYTQMVDGYAKEPLKRIEYLRKAKAIWDKIAPNNLNAIANIGNFGYSYFEIVKDPAMLKIVENKLGLSREQMLLDAEKYLKTSIELSDQAGSADLVSQLTIVYAQLCEYKKDYQGAIFNLKRHYKLQDSISSQTIKNKIAKLDGEREIAIRDKQIQLSKLEMRQFWLFGILAGVVMISILLYLLNLYRIRQLRFKSALQNHQAEQKALQLTYQYQLSESELKAIRSQMNPHFIFNVLNSIESYIMDNEKKIASRLIQKFATLSRLILENSTKSLVTADKEWRALKLYTELEAMRYNNSFSYEFIVAPEVQLQNLLLPPMLIQPLIENAILHGLIVDHKPDAHLEVKLTRGEKNICITITDNGVGLQNRSTLPKRLAGVKEKSMGIESILERIEMINLQNNNNTAKFAISSNENGIGTVAVICLPVLLNMVAAAEV